MYRHEDQLNDVNEYHRREITVLKQELTSLEEKMEYHAHERARDVQVNWFFRSSWNVDNPIYVIKSESFVDTLSGLLDATLFHVGLLHFYTRYFYRKPWKAARPELPKWSCSNSDSQCRWKGWKTPLPVPWSESWLTFYCPLWLFY